MSGAWGGGTMFTRVLPPIEVKTSHYPDQDSNLE